MPSTEVGDQRLEPVELDRQRFDAPAHHLADPHRGGEIAIAIKAELQVIGVHQVVQRSAVPLELLLQRLAAQIHTHILRLDIAHRDIAPREDVVRRPAGDPLRLIGHRSARAHGTEQALQVAPVTMLGGAPAAVKGVDGGEVFGEGHWVEK